MIGTDGGRTNRIRHADTIWPEFRQLGGKEEKKKSQYLCTAGVESGQTQRGARCGVALDQLTLYLGWKFKVRGRKSNISPLRGNLKSAASGFCSAQTQPQTKRGLLYVERKGGG